MTIDNPEHPTDQGNYTYENSAEARRVILVNTTGTAVGDTIKTKELNQLVPHEFDAIALTYTGSDVATATYYTGGTGGSSVATLTLTYSGGNLSAVERT